MFRNSHLSCRPAPSTQAKCQGYKAANKNKHSTNKKHGNQQAVKVTGNLAATGLSQETMVKFLAGYAQLWLVHDAVQHSIKFGQQLAGGKVRAADGRREGQ